MTTNTTHIVIFTGMYYEKYGAVEHYFLELAKQLNAQKKKVTFVYNSNFNTSEYYKDLSYYSEIIILSPSQSLSKLCSAIYLLLKQLRPHVVHSHFNPKLVRLVSCFAFLMRVPKRYNTFHGMAQVQKKITKIWIKALSILNTHQFAISNAIRNELIDTFNIKPHQITTLRLGLNKARHKKYNKQDVIKKYNLPTDGILIANVAFHSPIKGVDILLDAVKCLTEKTDKKIYLCQIGGEQEPYSTFLKEKVIHLKLKHQVLWLGLQDNVPELLQAFDIYVQPSRSEGLGLAILEAFCAKLPVVAANVGGIPEIVTDATGILFQAENSTDLADKLIGLLNAKQKRHVMGKAAKSYIMQNYELLTQVKQQINYYIN